MKIDFTNINFADEIQLDLNINDLNFKIKNVCNNLPALNIAKNSDLLNLTIKKTESFKQDKKKFVVFGTGGSNLGARALINILVDQPDNILFFDNIDPLFFQSQILKLDFETTGFVVINLPGVESGACGLPACRSMYPGFCAKDTVGQSVNDFFSWFHNKSVDLYR